MVGHIRYLEIGLIESCLSSVIYRKPISLCLFSSEDIYKTTNHSFPCAHIPSPPAKHCGAYIRFSQSVYAHFPFIPAMYIGKIMNEGSAKPDSVYSKWIYKISYLGPHSTTIWYTFPQERNVFFCVFKHVHNMTFVCNLYIICSTLWLFCCCDFLFMVYFHRS